MYTCLMPLLKWELAEVAMVEGVLGSEQAAGWAGHESEVRRGEARRPEELLIQPALLPFSALPHNLLT